MKAEWKQFREKTGKFARRVRDYPGSALLRLAGILLGVAYAVLIPLRILGYAPQFHCIGYMLEYAAGEIDGIRPGDLVNLNLKEAGLPDFLEGMLVRHLEREYPAYQFIPNGDEWPDYSAKTEDGRPAARVNLRITAQWGGLGGCEVSFSLSRPDERHIYSPQSTVYAYVDLVYNPLLLRWQPAGPYGVERTSSPAADPSSPSS